MSGGDAQEAVVTVRVRKEDRERMQETARREGLSFSAWSRKILLAAVDR